jgi:uncharacterized membrane protein YhaH (DUF805 family)
MRGVLSEVWLAALFSALSAGAFIFAMLTGGQLAEVAAASRAKHGGSRAAVAAALGAFLMLVAIVFWIAYMVFGPLHDAAAHLPKD